MEITNKFYRNPKFRETKSKRMKKKVPKRGCAIKIMAKNPKAKEAEILRT